MAIDKIKRFGQWFYVQSTGFYYSTRTPIDGERLLHRIVWKKHNGPIPADKNVHHKDNDWTNNEIGNLELRDVGQHSRHHCLKSWMNPEIAKKMRSGLTKAIEAATFWHSTPEGVAWHKKHGKYCMQKRLQEKSFRTCEECGETFQCYLKMPSRWCSGRCSNRHFNRKKQQRKHENNPSASPRASVS